MARALGGPHPPSPAPGVDPAPEVALAPEVAPAPPSFDWDHAEAQVGDLASPVFVDEENAPAPAENAWDVERSTITLSDVRGMSEVKERLEMSFLAPLHNPQLRKLYNKSLRGGMLLYGPSGCGKTCIARAIAGEMGAAFTSVAWPTSSICGSAANATFTSCSSWPGPRLPWCCSWTRSKRWARSAARPATAPCAAR